MTSQRIIMATAVLAAVTIACAAMAADDDAGLKERTVTWDLLPAAVQASARAEAGDHEILEIEEATRKDGTVFYDVEWRDGDNEVSVKIAPDGKVLARETEKWDEEEAGEDRDED